MALLLEIHEGCFCCCSWLSHDWSWIQLLWRRDNLNLKLKYPKLN